MTQESRVKLAIEGGPKAIRKIYLDKWHHFRWQDAIPIMKALYRKQVTRPGGGGKVADFENKFAALCGVKYGLAMNSGTAALHSALFAVGVGPGDEVILPSYTWHATASAVLCCGAKPVFCDIDSRTLTLCPEDMQSRITPKTKAVIPVHLWGNPCQMDKIMDIAKTRNLKVVEDSSHAHGALFKGKSVGSWGDIGCFSLQGAKAVSAGEGGIAVCSNSDYFNRMLALGHPLRTAGGPVGEGLLPVKLVNLGPKYRPHYFGILVADASLERLSKLNYLRRRNWKILCEQFTGCCLITPLASHPESEMGGFLEFKLILNSEKLKGHVEDFIKAVNAEGVPLTLDRYEPLHKSEIFHQDGPLTLKYLEPKNSVFVNLPVIDSLKNRILTLPAFTDVPIAYLKKTASAIRKVAEHPRFCSSSS